MVRKAVTHGSLVRAYGIVPCVGMWNRMRVAAFVAPLQPHMHCSELRTALDRLARSRFQPACVTGAGSRGCLALRYEVVFESLRIEIRRIVPSPMLALALGTARLPRAPGIACIRLRGRNYATPLNTGGAVRSTSKDPSIRWLSHLRHLGVGGLSVHSAQSVRNYSRWVFSARETVRWIFWSYEMHETHDGIRATACEAEITPR